MAFEDVGVEACSLKDLGYVGGNKGLGEWTEVRETKEWPLGLTPE